MEQPASFTPDLIKALADAGGLVFAILSGIVAAIWTVLRFLDDRREARKETARLEEQRLEQQRIDEQGRRAERVSELVAKFGESDTPEIRVWTMLALSLYPQETTRLLTMSLGQFSDEEVTGVQLALVSIGTGALNELFKMNRISQLSAGQAAQTAPQPGLVYDVNKLLARTRSVIGQIILRMDEHDFEDREFSEIDLSGASFEGATLRRISFRKCCLRDVNFKRANLRRSRFRGADLEGAFFTHAALNQADFTGARGKISAIKTVPEGAIFHYVDFSNSEFDGASLKAASFARATMENVSFRGAQLHECTIDRSFFPGLLGQSLKAPHLVATGSKFAKAELERAVIPEARFERCELVGLRASGLDARKTSFVDCNLGGADLSGADLTGASFRGCQLGGADLRGAKLTGCSFLNCATATTQLDDGVALGAAE